MLLVTLTNPAPAAGDGFGHAVVAMGSDQVLIAAPWDDTGVTDAGAVYLFGTSGALLGTFFNPTPASYDQFGISVAAMGNDRVLVGADADDTGEFNAGAAYLLSFEPLTLEAPSLDIRLKPSNTLAVSWPSLSTGWTLQQNTNGVASANWSNAPGTIQDDGTTKTLQISPPTGERFYRLFKQ